MSIAIIDPTFPAELEELLMPGGKLIPVPAADLSRFTQEQMSAFCHKHAVYQLPTTELIRFLEDEIGDRTAIEIGAGNGAVGRALGITMTDSCLQQSNLPGVRELYDLNGIPRIQYPDDVLKITGNHAVMQMKPQVVVGCWITERYNPVTNKGNVYGVDELQLARHTQTYIHVGNSLTHGDKGLLGKYYYEEVKAGWLYSRSMQKEHNVIYIFNFLKDGK